MSQIWILNWFCCIIFDPFGVLERNLRFWLSLCGIIWNRSQKSDFGQIWPKWWPNLANFGPNLEKNQIGSILHQKVLFLKNGAFWPKFGHLAIWPNGQISKFQWSALKCVKFWIYHFLMQNRTNLIFFKIWPKIGQIRPSFWPNLAKIWFWPNLPKRMA